MVSRSHTGTSGSASIFVSPQVEADFGSYICKAWNKLGTVEFNVEVVRSGIEVCHDFFFFCHKHDSDVMSSIPVCDDVLAFKNTTKVRLHTA